MFFKRLFKSFASLRLTVVLLAFSIILVWVGTIAQADEGLYQAQTRYFKEWFVVGAHMFGHHIPLVLPGGYLLGTLLLINLVAAHLQRFQFTRKKIGIHVAHAGIILLLLGQLTTDIFSHETQIHFAEGETKSYAESSSKYELAFVTSADANHNQEIVIPGKLLASGGEIKNPQLPFTIRVKSYWHNSKPSFRAPMMKNGPPITTNGIAMDFDFHPAADVKTMDDKNAPTALIEISSTNGSLGSWIVSDWAGDDSMLDTLRFTYSQNMGDSIAQTIIAKITQPQSIEVGGKKFTFTLRPQRVYTPFSLTLLKATHSVYPGTDIPKDFRSRIRLQNPKTGEDREVEIYMNSPLRYAGLTFYQYQMSPGEMALQSGERPWSVLQVVRNPSWLTPYIGCAMVAAGLVIQFLSHLIGFISKRKPNPRPKPEVREREAEMKTV
ncbi:MAG TPA: cytochrome c biogenesis protein ResB [Verrucomicrobiae bacterium]|nr:cytochrome c biogenesis protein ResB [Verrucomicrobiae bacterium]